MKYRKISVNGIQIFYRETGSKDKPTMVLFHGFPSASHMFRDLMPMLEDSFHLIAPDYPGFGQSESPSRDEYSYTFDHLARTMDPSFVWAGAEAFRKDVPDARVVPVASGHFALENCCAEIAKEIIGFF